MFTTRWQKQLYKVADLVFEIPCGVLPEWDDSQYKPLVVGIVFPFLLHRPWQLRNTPKLLGVARKLCMLWKEDTASARDFLCKLCQFTWTLDTLSKGLVWELLQAPHPGLLSGLRAQKGDEKRFCVGRNGDNLITHFQCDLRTFWNIQRKNPIKGKPTDELMNCCIRRANLDSLWSREKSTVSSNVRNVVKAIQTSEQVDMQMPYEPLGPMPLEDLTGHRVAIQMLLYSLEPGTHSKNYKQFDTIRKMRSSFSNAWGASAR
jgi:hypothetical protein